MSQESPLKRPDSSLIDTVNAAVPAGRWAVGVSGGADSVALLWLLDPRSSSRTDLSLHVVHLDHQTRGAESATDAEFVRDLAVDRGVACTVFRREDVEREMTSLPSNPSARYRALRHEAFRRVAAAHGLQGVLLAHHADDQAETVLHRLIRGSGPAGLAGMRQVTHVAGLTILRPLLQILRDELRRFLAERWQPWREDASNASDRYFRNRLRRLLARHPHLSAGLIELADACAAVRDWSRSAAPRLAAEFPAPDLQRLPAILAAESAQQWLLSRGVPVGALSESPDAVGRLISLATDAGTPGRSQFPGGVTIRRRKGVIGAG